MCERCGRRPQRITQRTRGHLSFYLLHPLFSPSCSTYSSSSTSSTFVNMTFADLRALHAVIGAAIDDIERIYRPPSSLRRPSQSSMSTTSSAFAGRSPSKPRSPSIPRSSTSTDSDLEDDDGSDSMPPTPLTASNIRMQQSANSVRFASGRKRRERSYTLSALPPSSSSPGPMPPPILKQPPLDFPALDIPVPVFETSSTLPKLASSATVTPASSPRLPTAPLLTIDVESLGTSPSVDPTQRRREWHKKCEDLTTHPEVIKAVNKIVAACGQLSAAVQKPFLTVCDAAMGVSRLFYPLHVSLSDFCF